MDLSIFNNNDNHCFNGNEDTVDTQKCSHLQRMLHALKYYTALKVENASNAGIFMEFCNDIYTDLLDDYQHIITTHEQDLEEINEQLIEDDNFGECNLNQCALFGRYNTTSIRRPASNITSNQQQDTAVSNESKSIFYMQILDGMHIWILHLYWI